jgi:sRNA-binding protein
MSAQEQAAEGKSAEETDKADGKKPGFLEKLKKLLFGEDEDEDNISLQGGNGTDAAALSAENAQILQELEETEGKKAKKEKKKKEKKPKKAKPKKQPKPKKPPKPKKEKPPKQPDNTPPLPKGPVIAIIVMVASLFGLVMLGTKLLGYQSNISAAKEAEKTGDYVTAFESLQGLSVKAKDEQLYNRLSALAAVSEKYEAYLVFDNYGSKDAALDALVCAYGRCSVNQVYEEEYDCKEELEELKGKITEALLSEYDMTGEEALSIYEITDRNEYTRELRRKLRDLGMEE